MPKIKRAIISLSDKSGIVEFAKGLHELGVEILSTGGTAKTLRDNKIPVVDVSAYTGSPEILDGRLKTLHPKIHGGLLGMRNNKKHKEEMAANSIEPIDMVVVNLYPFESTIAKPNCSLEEAIENIDIGGPTMLRAAAKNWHDVAVIVDPAEYSQILSELKNSGGEISKETCFKLAQKVFATTARYDAAICNYLNVFCPPHPLPSPLGGEGWVRGRFPSTLALTFNKVQDLRYGENPHQQAAFYKCPHLPKDVACISNGHQLHGKELSYNNIMDADAAIELVKEFSDKIASVVIKHTNPCGAAVSPKSLAEAFVTARDCDSTSAFGGIVALTRPVDAETAKAIGDTFFEVIIAPSFKSDALEILKAKKNLRLLEIPPLTLTLSPQGRGVGEGINALRKVAGGLLVSDYDTALEDIRGCKVVTKRKPTDDEYKGLEFAWRLVKHVKSNAIVLSTSDRLLGVGAGQTSRVDSVKIAIEKMKSFTIAPSHHRTIALGSDAFFPFRDGIDLVAAEGITAVVQPGGSIRDEDIIKAANEHDIAMVFTGVRHFRH
jgi:phosphoribosylaminoimidazolecarboxamide formyltransferase/IMP cyclohydrolase